MTQLQENIYCPGAFFMAAMIVALVYLGMKYISWETVFTANRLLLFTFGAVIIACFPLLVFFVSGALIDAYLFYNKIFGKSRHCETGIYRFRVDNKFKQEVRSDERVNVPLF